MQVGQFQSYSPQVSYGGLQAPTINPYGAGGSNPSSGMNMLGMMFSLMQSLAQLSQGWGSFGGGGFGSPRSAEFAPGSAPFAVSFWGARSGRAPRNRAVASARARKLLFGAFTSLRDRPVARAGT